MIQEVLQVIVRYFDDLQAEGYYVSFHNLAIPMDSCMEKLTPYNINSNPFCLLIKSSSEAWNYCIKRQKRVLDACAGGPFCGICYAGMGEYVFPIHNKLGEPLAFLSVSGYQIEKERAMERISVTARRFDYSEARIKQSYDHDLKAELPDFDELSARMAPLCRMFELLNILLSDLPHGAVGNLAQNNILGHAVVYLRRHYASSVSASDVAEVCHCSVSTLSHLFKKKMGVSIRKYQQQLRLSDAGNLLRDTDLPVNVISDLLGYGNPNYFCNVFRDEIGIAPSQYREQYQKEKKN